MTCFRTFAAASLLVLVVGCTKKDEPIPLPGEPEGTDPRVVGVAETGVVSPSASAVEPSPGTTGAVTTPKGDAGVPDGGLVLPPVPALPPSLLPTGLPSSLPPLPTLLPSAFPLPLPAKT
jgi:hypothetical protein